MKKQLEEVMEEKTYILPKPVTNAELFAMEQGSFCLTKEQFEEDERARARIPKLASAVEIVTDISGWPEKKIPMTNNEIELVHNVAKAGGTKLIFG